MKTTDDLWVDVSYTVKASTLNGGSLMRNTRTGEEKIVTDEDVLDFGQLALNFDEPLPDADISEEGEPKPALPAFFDAPPVAPPKAKPKAKVKK